MIVGIDVPIFNLSSDLDEDRAKMEIQVARINSQNSGSSSSNLPNAEVSA